MGFICSGQQKGILYDVIFHDDGSAHAELTDGTIFCKPYAYARDCKNLLVHKRKNIQYIVRCVLAMNEEEAILAAEEELRKYKEEK